MHRQTGFPLAARGQVVRIGQVGAIDWRPKLRRLGQQGIMNGAWRCFVVLAAPRENTSARTEP